MVTIISNILFASEIYELYYNQFLYIDDQYWDLKGEAGCILMINANEYPNGILRMVNCSETFANAGYEVPGICETTTGE